MTYEMFKQLVVDYAHKFVPDEWKDREMDVRKVHKVNKDLDAICFFEKGDGACLAPTIYIQDMYDRYKVSGDVASSIKSVIDEIYIASQNYVPDIRKLAFKEKCKDMIVVRLINTEQNRHMLENIPHREIEDLSIVYRWIAELADEGMQSICVDNEWAENLGMNEEELYQMAIKNTERIFPPVIQAMSEYFVGSLIEQGIPEEVARLVLEEQQSGPDLYVISNRMGLNGAAVVLYEDTLQDLAEKLDDDLYIMPSSIHEMFAVSAKEVPNVERLADLVVEANMTVVNLDERLSNQVYHYDKELRKLTMATDTPNKRLDGKELCYEPVLQGKGQAR